jgi:hypothetical protein
MSQAVGIADLEAVGDVLDWVCEQSDSMSIETAIAMRDALDALGKKVAMAKSLCETQAKKMLDGQPIKIGDTIYVEKDTGKWRPNQPRIRNVIVTRAIYDENGERIGGIQAHHIIKKPNYWLRYSLDNGICLPVYEHEDIHFEKSPKQFMDEAEKAINPPLVETLTKTTKKGAKK